jgi:hypothetical protein
VVILTRPPRLIVSDKGDGAGAGADGMAMNGKSGSGSNGLLLELKAGRRFVIREKVENASQGWTEARVNYLNSCQQEEEEIDK